MVFRDPQQFNPSPHADASADPAAGPRDVGLVFIGDSLVAGYGDPKGLGWVSRVVARTQHPDLDLTSYNLGIRGDSSADVLARWRAECPPRWAARTERRLVIGVGAGDVQRGITTARSRLNLANILDDAQSQGIAAFVVGTPPSADQVFNATLEIVNEAQADVCARRGVPFVDCYKPLLGHDQWTADLDSSADGFHPGQAGYGLIAWLVLHGGWDEWMRLSR